MLLVVAVISLLISILLPTLRQAKDATIVALCQTRLHTMHNASVAYATDNAGWFPWRSSSGAYMPHLIKGSNFDLNKSFVAKYLGSREPTVQCPGKLNDVRNLTLWPSYGDIYFSFQYCNYPAGGWVVPKPKLQRSGADGRYALWTCLTTFKGFNWLGHDAPETPVKPSGQNAVRIDGSAQWHPWASLEIFVFVESHEFYWPKR